MPRRITRAAFSRQGQSGLSPRVRGNLEFLNAFPTFLGSIPACAGEPETLVSALLKAQVYPRVCGGTVLGSYDPNAPYGLSPRVRGNRSPVAHRNCAVGSIPACAGEPAPSASCPSSMQVYPRVCGGTSYHIPEIYGPGGLSPRVRGNLND